MPALLPTIPDNGWLHELDFELYLGIDRISSHGLMEITRSPAHYEARRVEERKPPSKALAFGTLAHSAVLEPARFKDKCVLMPDFGAMQSSKNRANRDAWLADQPREAIVCSEEDFVTIQGMCEGIMRHKRAFELLSGEVKTEISGFWHHPHFDVPCKARLDALRADLIVIDYKTAESARLKDFQRDALNYNYHMQCAHNLDTVSAIEGEPVTEFVFIVQEKKPPYAVAVYVADDSFVTRGRNKNRRAMQLYAECKKKAEWPGYSEDIFNLMLPPWADYDED